jgi:hypothetical protein
VDESQPVSQLMVVICSKMGIANHEEYSLVRGSQTGVDVEDDYGSDYSRERSPYYNGNSVMMNTIGRKKEKQIQQLRF